MKNLQTLFVGDNGKFYNLSYEQIFMEQDGRKMMANVPDFFSKFFDWQVTKSKIYKNDIVEPKTVYTKTDFLPFFVYSVLPQIKNEFILITACSDFSPQVNWNDFHWEKYYKILINNPKLKFWYMNNMRYKNEKTFSLPMGFGASSRNILKDSTEKDIDQKVIKIRDGVNTEEKIDKIFCCFRDRDWNVCGEDMIIRPQILKIINDNREFFEFYDDLPLEDFIETLAKYKYCLQPHGNGMDPSPTCWQSLAVKTIPVIYKSPNVVSMFEGTDSVIFFDKFEQIIDRNLYVDKDPIEFEFLTCEYWANKIKSKI